MRIESHCHDRHAGFSRRSSRGDDMAVPKVNAIEDTDCEAAFCTVCCQLVKSAIKHERDSARRH